MTSSLIQYFKKTPVLDTDVGSFEYEADLGQGGNANVLKFKRGDHAFAIKFIPHGEESKLRRFRDEFFSAAQIPTHQNVVRTFHFDTRTIDGTTYSLIVMKAYENTLSKIGSIKSKDTETQSKEAWRLFIHLCDGLRHLHNHHIIHRDIKPQNIFYDSQSETFVIGDLGISHFSPLAFSKEAHTKPAERLANYMFSAPEQVDSRKPISAAADIYSLGQVIQWYLTEKTVRGQGRPSFSQNTRDRNLEILDAFTNKALRDNPIERFQSIDEVTTFIKESREPARRDPWTKIHAFDRVIRQSFPHIRRTLKVTSQEEIGIFLNLFQKECNSADFWYVMADGGDGHFESLENLTGKSWLLNSFTEMTVSRLLVHRDDGYPYKNFFIILFGPDKRFIYSTADGKRTKRKPSSGWNRDLATLVDGSFYIDPNETNNGFFRMNGETLAVTRERFKDRERYLEAYGFMVVPTGTASASMIDRDPTKHLIQAAIRDRDINEMDLNHYLNVTRSYHSSEITMHN